MPTLSDDSVFSISENSQMEKEKKKTRQQSDFLSQRPGYLESEGRLQIKTRVAQRHFLPLLTFAKQAKIIYQAAKQDDPYADECLLEMEKMLGNAQNFIQEKTRFYQQHLPASSSLSLPLADTKKPLSLPLRFTTPYAHIAARILVEFDTLARWVISLYQWGLVAEIPLTALLHELSQPLYLLWRSAKNWQTTGLTRAALLENADILSTKPLDPHVLNKERRAKYAPRIFVFTSRKSSPTETRKRTQDFSTSNSLT